MTWGLLGVLVIILAALFRIWFREGKDAPFVPSEDEVVGRVIRLASVTKDDIVYDLGSGDGRFVIGASLKGAKAIGVELNPLRVLYSRFWLKLLKLDKKAKIINEDIFKINLEDADVVICYLLQSTNDRLQHKLAQELRIGTRVVSLAFEFTGWEKSAIDLKGVYYGPLRLYKITKKMKESVLEQDLRKLTLKMI